jgi:hypothetical protein
MQQKPFSTRATVCHTAAFYQARGFVAHGKEGAVGFSGRQSLEDFRGIATHWLFGGFQRRMEKGITLRSLSGEASHRSMPLNDWRLRSWTY